MSKANSSDKNLIRIKNILSHIPKTGKDLLNLKANITLINSMFESKYRHCLMGTFRTFKHLLINAVLERLSKKTMLVMRCPYLWCKVFSAGRLNTCKKKNPEFKITSQSSPREANLHQSSPTESYRIKLPAETWNDKLMQKTAKFSNVTLFLILSKKRISAPCSHIPWTSL